MNDMLEIPTIADFPGGGSCWSICWPHSLHSPGSQGEEFDFNYVQESAAIS